MNQSCSCAILPRLSVPGTWLLGPREAVTLRPSHRGVLRVAEGELWVTFDGPHAGAANDCGDQLLRSSDSLELRRGQRLVIEPAGTAAPARFRWDPMPAVQVFGWPVPTLLIRAVLVVAAGAVTAGLWAGFAAQSRQHRVDAYVTDRATAAVVVSDRKGHDQPPGASTPATH